MLVILKNSDIWLFLLHTLSWNSFGYLSKLEILCVFKYHLFYWKLKIIKNNFMITVYKWNYCRSWCTIPKCTRRWKKKWKKKRERNASAWKRRRNPNEANLQTRCGKAFACGKTLRVCLDRTYFAETENLLLKSL